MATGERYGGADDYIKKNIASIEEIGKQIDDRAPLRNNADTMRKAAGGKSFDGLVPPLRKNKRGQYN